MHPVTDDGIVVALTDYSESDLIVSLFTREHGKIRGFARGGRKSRRRFGGALELFARVRVTYLPKDGLARLDEAASVTLFPGIRQDLEKIAFAGYVCELVDAFLPEGLPNPRFFRLVSACLDHLDVAAATPADRRFFEINLLNVLGYSPPLDVCPSCGRDPAAEGAVLSGTDLLCRNCASGGGAISGETIRILRGALRTGRFGSASFSPSELGEAGLLLDRFIHIHCGRQLYSLKFLGIFSPVTE